MESNNRRYRPKKKLTRFGKLRNNVLRQITCHGKGEAIGVLEILQNEPNHSSLHYLGLYNKISIDTARLIAKVLKINKSINTFHVRSVCSDGIVAIVGGLSDNNNTTLMKLDLHGNTIDSTAVVAICRMLKTNNALTELCIYNCNVDSDGAIVIGDALKFNTALERLGLGYNSIGDVGAVAISDGIKENSSSSLNVLNIEGNDIGSNGARSIAAMLTTNKSLTELNLCFNEMIGTEGVIAIAEALKQNRSLVRLDFDHFQFGDDLAKSVASMLTTNVSLEKLVIREYEIGDDGATAIANALRTNQSLTYLGICLNLISVASMLTTNVSLEKLVIREYEIGDDGVTAIVYALKVNKSLTALHLDGIPISNSVIANEFAPMLEINTTLKELSYNIERIDNVSAGAILKALQDYNDTVNVKMNVYWDLDDNNDEDHDDELKLMLRKISDISQENCEGIHCAPKKYERKRHNIFDR